MTSWPGDRQQSPSFCRLRRLGRWALLFPLSIFISSVSQAELQVQLLQSEYLSAAQNDVQTSHYSSLGLKYKSLQEVDFIKGFAGVDLMGLGAVDGAENGYFAAPEAYVAGQMPFGQQGTWVVGRKRMTWSHFDEEWRLGIWQPNVRWDYLHPTSEGLTGLFVNLDRSDFHLTGFVTPIFLPDQGPQFDVVDGQFRSSNRWFRQPTSRHTVMDQPRKINYELDRPKASEILNNAGYGLSMTLGREESGLWLKTSLANKPINQLHIGIEGYHSLAQDDRLFQSVVTVHPMVARHTLMTVETGLHEDDYQAWLSLTEERPDRPDVPEDWEESTLYSSQFIGGVFSHRIPIDGFRNQWLKYGYMHLREKIPTAPDGSQSDTLESSLDRYPFAEVASLEWVAPIINKARLKVDTGIRYLYSIPEKGGLISAKAEMLWDRVLRLDFGVDILGSGVDEHSPHRGLMTLYRNNDRVIGGLTYVF